MSGHCWQYAYQVHYVWFNWNLDNDKFIELLYIIIISFAQFYSYVLKIQKLTLSFIKFFISPQVQIRFNRPNLNLWHPGEITWWKFISSNEVNSWILTFTSSKIYSIGEMDFMLLKTLITGEGCNLKTKILRSDNFWLEVQSSWFIWSAYKRTYGRRVDILQFFFQNIQKLHFKRFIFCISEKIFAYILSYCCDAPSIKFYHFQSIF